jgi:hypothetical protein
MLFVLRLYNEDTSRVDKVCEAPTAVSVTEPRIIMLARTGSNLAISNQLTVHSEVTSRNRRLSVSSLDMHC